MEEKEDKWIPFRKLNSNIYYNKEEATKLRLEKLREQVAMDPANACWEVTDKAIR
ncbi:hypothetical protein Gotur_004219 [Gossypium turneri]